MLYSNKKKGSVGDQTFYPHTNDFIQNNGQLKNIKFLYRKIV